MRRLTLLLLLAACRGPDYVEVGGGYGWQDGLSGTSFGGPPGQPSSSSFDGGGDSQAVALTVGWQLSGTNQDLLDKLDRLQEAMMAGDAVQAAAASHQPPPAEPPPESLQEEGGVDWKVPATGGAGALLTWAIMYYGLIERLMARFRKPGA